MMEWKPLNEKSIQTIMGIIEMGIIEKGRGKEKDEIEINKLIYMVPTCSNLNKKVGDIVHLLARPTGGTAPYTISFNKGTTLLKQIVNVSEGQVMTFDYTLTDTDANLTQTFSSVILDSCGSGPKQCIESCDITVVGLITCGTPSCNLVVT